MTTTAVRTPARTPVALTVARGVLGLFGAVKLAGTAYFTFVASAEAGGDPQGAVDWLVVAWSTALAVSFLVAAVRLGSGGGRALAVLAGVLVVDIVFSGVKLLAYDEPEAVGFMAVDLLLLALLAAVRTRR
ncbi:hypothetical protein GCU56_06665 [Geodermatophilus sabuli]|uniref:Uncharacterized protein n=1 Tax=Geodermatophilus sabuli TaxID=1564158 RepID=A0A7K3VY74_9ACTN|nr:hypothetical protein [Geodermatophilus sabuli]NEK57552.1 hypothetical protein [Geodermatophilus sabuli]